MLHDTGHKQDAFASEENDLTSRQPDLTQQLGRRRVLKAALATGGAVATLLLPERWVKPVVQMGILPAHAQISPRPTPTPNPTVAPTQTPTATPTATATQPLLPYRFLRCEIFDGGWGIVESCATIDPPDAGIELSALLYVDGDERECFGDLVTDDTGIACCNNEVYSGAQVYCVWSFVNPEDGDTTCRTETITMG